MSKMHIMVGLPGSGKSTRAKEIIAEGGNVVRINKDLLRKMLHFDKWSGTNEGRTKDASRALAEYFLTHGVNVIIDDTNFNPSVIDSWKELAQRLKAEIKYHRIETSVEECLKRDSQRQESVGRDVIVQMALQYGLYPKPEKGFILCDVDGTLADITHRKHWLEGKKDWRGFFSQMAYDTPRQSTFDMLKTFSDQGYEIIVVSARPDDYRGVTALWLEKNGITPYKTLIMRPGSDSRPDTEVKQQMYDKYFKGKYEVTMVIDDRPSVIEMWRSNGLDVIDVGDGVPF